MTNSNNKTNFILLLVFALSAFSRLGINAQNFQSSQQNPFGITGTDGYSAPAFCDLDGDGDMDMMAGSMYGGLFYYQNSGSAGAPNFPVVLQNPFGLSGTNGYSSPGFADLDGDGDRDMMVGSMYGSLYYYQNTGTASSPSFAGAVQNPFGLSGPYGYSAPAFGDLDGDGDQDMMSGSMYGSLYYYQNTGTASSPYFASAVQNPFGISSPYGYSAPSFGDLDGDGDLDLLSGSLYGGLYYYQNTGTVHVPNFPGVAGGPFGLTGTDGYSSPAFIDMDGDGDLEIMAGSLYGSFYYYMNLDASGIFDGNMNQFPVMLYPNPGNGIVKLDFAGSQMVNKTSFQMSVMNVFGEEVFHSETGSGNAVIDITNKPDGIYFVVIYNETGSCSGKFVKTGN